MLALALAVLGLLNPDAQLQNGLDLSKNGFYEESERVLKEVPPKSVKNYEMYNYARLLNNFATNNKAEAEKYAKNLEDSFTHDLPTRYKALAYMMTEDLKRWKKDDLGDIERDMKKSADRLGKAQGGERTQQVQKEIVAKLDKLIKEQEDKANGGKGEGQDAAQGKPKPGQGQGQGQPAPDSVVMGGSGKGKIDEKELRKVAETWGTLPPAKRAQVVQEITRDLPDKFRPMIEEYFKALNKTHGYKK